MLPIMRHSGPVRLALAGLGSAALALAGSGTALAAAGYGPPPAAISISGSYRAVPRRTFMAPVQVTLTAPDTASVGGAALHRRALAGGVGLVVQRNGKAYAGRFRKPITITVTSTRLAAGDRIAAWNGRRFVTLPATTGWGGPDQVWVRSRASGGRAAR